MGSIKKENEEQNEEQNGIQGTVKFNIGAKNIALLFAAITSFLGVLYKILEKLYFSQ